MKTLLLAFLLAAVCCAQSPPLPATTAPDAAGVTTDPLSAAALRKDVSYLASDDLEGRATPSRGLDLAADFLEKRHRTLGLKPLFGEAFREGPMLADATKASLSIHFADETVTLDASAFLQAAQTPLQHERLPLQHVDAAQSARTSAESGTASEHALLLDGAPSAAALARATRRKAKIVLIEETSADALGARVPVVVLGRELAEKLRAHPDALVSVTIPAGTKPFATNVGALLEGRDATLKSRCIVVSAHYDHIGIGKPVKGDAIRNGADDDASGTAGVLALAAAMATTPARRSILFVHFYGEESGFLGSRRFVTQPPRALAQIDAVFNLEMLGRPDDIGADCAWITGFGLSEFGERVAKSGAVHKMRFFEHPRYSKMLFSGSDNLPFAEAGVVAHSISSGSLHKDYHQPSDEADTLDYNNMAKVVGALLHAVRDMADADTAPAWVPGSRYAEAAARLR